jgi:hypothetical protein
VTTKPESQFAYSTETVRCHACAAQSRTVEKFGKDGGDQAGILSRFTKAPPLE